MVRINRGTPLVIVGVLMALFVGFIQAPVTASAAATGTVAPSSVTHQLRVRNAGKMNITVCESWMYIDGVQYAKKCKDSVVGLLKPGQKSYKKPLKWPDVDAVRVPKGYSLYREIRGAKGSYDCAFASTKHTLFVKISPAPHYTGSFATTGRIVLAKSHLGGKPWGWSGVTLYPCSK